MNPEDVPDEWVRLAVRANADRNHVDLCGCIAWPEQCVSGYSPTQWEHGDEAHTIAAVLSAARKAWFVELMGDPEEHAKEPATPDDTVRLCELARPGEHERRVREQVAREIEETATFDAARSAVDASDGHEDHCEWHLTNGAYCSCRVWPAACAGVSVAALAVRGEAR